jgi:hypothetical protein
MIPERARLNASRGEISRYGGRSAWRKRTAPVPKHFAQARLLIRTNDSSRLEVDIKVGVHRIVAKIIFLQHGILDFVAAFLHGLGKGKFSTARTLYMTDQTSILASSISKAWTFSSSSSISSDVPYVNDPCTFQTMRILTALNANDRRE